MLTMRKTVNIPADRRLFLELPKTAPVGKAVVLVSFTGTGRPEQADTAFPTIEELKAEAAEKTAQRKMEKRKPFEGLYGCLKDSKTLEGDPAELAREWRGEWTNLWEDSI
ncbi:MAG: hypothetical protein LBP69_07560 [Treponema sp.]|nr:hypothetical protein [Treponema sp.]